MIMNLCWVTLQVTDLEKSTAFYRDKLGLPVTRELDAGDTQIVFLDAGGAEVELLCRKGEQAPEKAGDGISFALRVQDVEKLAASLKESGCAVVGPISPGPGSVFYFVNDEDGYTIQLVGA